MEYSVCFTPEASDQLVELYQYIAAHGSPVTAEAYTLAIVEYCEGFHTFPHRGTKRDDVLPGLRVADHQLPKDNDYRFLCIRETETGHHPRRVLRWSELRTPAVT